MYKCCIHILGCLLIWAIASSAQAASQQIHIDDPRFIKNPPAHILEKFTLDEDGYIIDGPRQADGEPIDHSILLSNQEIINNFLKVAFGNSEVSYHHALKFIRNLKKMREERYFNLTYISKIKQEDKLILQKAIEMVARLSNLTANHNNTKATLDMFIISVYSDQQALELANNFMLEYEKVLQTGNNNTGVENLKLIADLLIKLVKADNSRRFTGRCAVMPMINDEELITANAYIFYFENDHSKSRGCIYEEIIQSMGLYRDDDSLNFSMFTDSFKNYNYPTEQDIWMLRILYDNRLKHGMTKEEALPIIHAVIDDIRPYGKN